MNQRQNPRVQSGAECLGDPSGRIAFRLRIGVTGHRKLSQVPEIAARVQTELTRLVELTAADGSTIIELAVISQLAEGADRLVVDEVLSAAADRGRQARLEAVLPMHRDSYASAQGFTAASQREFDALMEEASLVIEPRRTVDGDGGDTALVYETAGRSLITRCDVLIAIWDGQPTGGRWGTAETLLAAASEGKPCVWIPTNPKESIQDNLMPGTSEGFRQLVGTRSAVPSDCARPPQVLPKDVLKPLRESLAPLQHFNRARLPAEFGGRLIDEFGFPGGEEDWIAPVFLRADVLAAKNQVRFAWSARAVSLLAITAAVMLGVHLSLSSSPLWDWAEVTSLAAVTIVFLVLRQREFHRRWMSYRFLAERLRSARFLIPAGVDLQWAMSMVAVYIERHSSDWILRAFDEFWQSERQRRRTKSRALDGDIMKRRLTDDWIGKQIAYHLRRSRDHRRWHRILLVTIMALFAGTIVCAVLDASAIARNVTGCLSVVFPTAAASLGALLTVRQHRELAERYSRMSSDLAVAQQAAKDAENRRTLAKVGAQAARIMAEENDDWLGALWFLDVEHPG